MNDSKEDRAFALARRGLWEEAAHLLTEENERAALPTGHYVRLQTALSLFADKGRGHQQTLARFADRFALAEGFWTAYTMLKSFDFDAKSVPLVSLAEMARSSRDAADPLAGFVTAWANYRVGKYPEAHALAKKLDKDNYAPMTSSWR